jgi:hypothetical protein
MPMNPVERCNEQQEGWKGQNLGSRCKKDSIDRYPLIYIEGVVLS